MEAYKWEVIPPYCSMELRASETPVTRGQIILIRGLPGTGKSTLAQAIQQRMRLGTSSLCDSDEYFQWEDDYNFDIDKVPAAVKFRDTKAYLALINGLSIIVPGVFVEDRSMDFYKACSAYFMLPILVHDLGNIPLGPERVSIHGVPTQDVDEMWSRWQEATPKMHGFENTPLPMFPSISDI